MMTERIDIDRLARKCGFAKWCSPDENSWTASHTELAAYTRAAIEECAKACDYDKPHLESDYRKGIRAGVALFAAAIRRMMP